MTGELMSIRMMFGDLKKYQSSYYPNRQLLDLLLGVETKVSNQADESKYRVHKIGNEYNFEQKEAILKSINVILLVQLFLPDTWPAGHWKDANFGESCRASYK